MGNVAEFLNGDLVHPDYFTDQGLFRGTKATVTLEKGLPGRLFIYHHSRKTRGVGPSLELPNIFLPVTTTASMGGYNTGHEINGAKELLGLPLESHAALTLILLETSEAEKITAGMTLLTEMYQQGLWIFGIEKYVQHLESVQLTHLRLHFTVQLLMALPKASQV